ncbi:hypothetical protein COLINT_03664 [Collinsella intestinalis DSM 13280]|uniref:Uncharacterized protein n=1 Tax=Collinsella intestinalis DSM 13280 TaxID=521003 RepID=C4FC46_9ACTN|nr:hypothetical protein COLINT_03664 [Collinsella intestinalis DSM 13280]
MAGESAMSPLSLRQISRSFSIVRLAAHRGAATNPAFGRAQST